MNNDSIRVATVAGQKAACATSDDAPTVAVIGGGLAGLAATVALAQSGVRVTLLESRDRLGGRAGSFVDAATGQLLDNCQHVSMGCCTALAAFARTVGIEHLFAPQPCLIFQTPDRRISRFKADPWPAPFHLARAFASAHYLSLRDKLAIAWGMFQLQRTAPDEDGLFAQWLARHRQTPGAIERFWAVVLTSALNETIDRIGVRYARKVFVDGFLTDRTGHVVFVPTAPLSEVYGGPELLSWLNRHGATVRRNAAVKSIDVENGAVARLRLRTGETVTADAYVAAVPFDRLAGMLPTDVAEWPEFAGLTRLESSPITSVHLWFDRPLTRWPHVVLVDCLGQWLFNRGESAPGEHAVQVVVSASRLFAGWGHDEVQRRVVEELGRLYPVGATLRRGRVVTEKRATFSVTPGVDRWRPGPTTGLANLVLAGDWTATGWPATMEGAIRSGTAAAAALQPRLVARLS